MIARIALDRPVDANDTPIFPNMEAYDAVTGARLGRVGLLRTDGIFIVTGVNGQGVRLPAESIAVTWDLPRLDSICDVCDAATADAIEHEVPGTGGETVTLCPDCATRDTIVNGVTLNAARDLMPVKMRRQDDGNWIVWASDRRIVDIEPNGPAFDVWAKADMLTGERAVIFTGKSISAVSDWLTETFQLDIENLTPEPTPPAADDTDNDPEPYESGVFGGAHPGDDEADNDAPADTFILTTVTGDCRWELPLALSELPGVLKDAERNGRKWHEVERTDGYCILAAEKPCYLPSRSTSYPQVRIPVAFMPQPDYATIPAIGGGSHEADTTTKPRNQATSQKRDNQRTARAALNEAYHTNAETQATNITDILTDMGFTLALQHERDDMTVRIWESEQAKIKQTPYTIRVYNRPVNRLPRHGDAEIINSVEAGWIMRTTPNGYAAGIVAAILPLIETPDPYMQALDAIEARDAEQSAPLPKARPIEQWSDDQLRDEIAGMEANIADIIADKYRGWPKGTIQTMRAVLKRDQDELARRQSYTIAAPGHDGRPVIIAEVEHHDIPELVLHGGQPSMTGPWQAPAISGGSQELCDECGTAPAVEQGLCRHCFDTHPGYCVKACGRLVTTHVRIDNTTSAGYCDECAPCQHDADEPPARFCSQCGHDRSPDAPQPTDTGTSHDVPTKYQTTCPTCDQRLVKTENWQQTCAATWSTPETLHGHTSAETAYLVDDYPYGARLRCQIRYWIESGKDGRQRFVSQTCNPKTGKWNNPKKSTYSEVMVMTIDSRGHIGYTALGSWPTECEMRHMETLLGEHITEAQAATMKTWRVMNQAQKHITYNVTSTGPLDIMHSAEDRATAAAFDATRQTKEEVNAIWNTAINRAVKELETA